MAGRFNGLRDEHWKIICKAAGFRRPPRGRRGRGRPTSSPRRILNTILWVLITGSRWEDVPRGSQWGKRSTSHRTLGVWFENGTMARIQEAMLSAAHQEELINWARAAIDGMFAAGKGGGEGVAHGFKGKGVTLHALVDGNGMPLAVRTTDAKSSERDEVIPLLDSVSVKGSKGRPRKRPDLLQLDKGYDSRELREKNPPPGHQTSHAAPRLEEPETAEGSQA